MSFFGLDTSVFVGEEQVCLGSGKTRRQKEGLRNVTTPRISLRPEEKSELRVQVRVPVESRGQAWIRIIQGSFNNGTAP